MYNYLLQFYHPAEFPALDAQIAEWKRSRPLAGKKILDATPVFRNTMMKHVALIEAGAELVVGFGNGIPYDPAVVELLEKYKVPLAGNAANDREYDVVLDCAGANSQVRSRAGYVELTRSGMYQYRDCLQPVFLADEGRIKEIETALGTGDGFRRGMARFGHGDFTGKKIVVFGCGKVGSGVVMYAVLEGAEVTVVDDAEKVKAPFQVPVIDLGDASAIEKAVSEAWCVVCATGIRHALCGRFDLGKLLDSSAHIVNMGVEDEFGPEIPACRVLNDKAPLNFILEEPTHLKYIDPTMALHNYGALEVLSGKLGPGLNFPSKELEETILGFVRSNGAVAPELEKMENMR